MNVFKRIFSGKQQIIEDPDGVPDYTYKGVWENKRQPSPGAQSFAWESLGLVQFVPSGPSINIRRGIHPMPGSVQQAIGQAVVLNGIAQTAGQIFGQQLYDPATGYVGAQPIENNFPFLYNGQPDTGGKIL